MIIENFGILAPISWNSNGWKGKPTQQDIDNSGFEYVQDEEEMHELLNFGHEQFPPESDGTYIAYTSAFRILPSEENSKNVHIVFFSSKDYDEDVRKIVGFYAYPEIGHFYRNAEHKMYEKYDYGQVKSLAENIVFFQNPVPFDNAIAHQRDFLPKNRNISYQGFNYLNSYNVLNLLHASYQENEDNQNLSNVLENIREEIDLLGYSQNTGETETPSVPSYHANSRKNLIELEQSMQNQTPQVKERISKRIERGTIANRIKAKTDYKCLICESLGNPPHSFRKRNSTYYVETHHVEPVATLGANVLGVGNLITVCANHHRQLHYGNVEVLENDHQEKFVFRIDGKEIEIKKLSGLDF